MPAVLDNVFGCAIIILQKKQYGSTVWMVKDGHLVKKPAADSNTATREYQTEQSVKPTAVPTKSTATPTPHKTAAKNQHSMAKMPGGCMYSV